MKKFRRILMVLAAPALLLYGLKELGGTPLYKGDESGFTWKSEANPAKLVLTNDVGEVVCMLHLRIPNLVPGYKVELENSSPLHAKPIPHNGEDGWIEIAGDPQTSPDYFKWPSGKEVSISPSSTAPTRLQVTDWEMYVNVKHPDSQSRAAWRHRGLMASIFFLALALIGGVLEAADKLQDKPKPLSPPKLLESLIENVTGATVKKSEWMRSILKKVFLQGFTTVDAMAGLPPMTDAERKGLLIAGTRQLQKQLEFFLKELSGYWKQIQKP